MAGAAVLDEQDPAAIDARRGRSAARGRGQNGIEPLPFENILWIEAEPEDLAEAYFGSGNRLVEDAFGNPVLLTMDERSYDYLQRRHPKLTFLTSRPNSAIPR